MTEYTLIETDICVIGAGSGGLSVAAAAAAFGVPTVLIERGEMGGDCLNVGCVPSKALIAAARTAHEMRHGAARFGIANVEPQIDFPAVMAHVKGVIASIAPHDGVPRYTAMGVKVIKADARFADADTVEAGTHRIKARRFVIATGSRPAVPPIDGLEGVPYLTNETLFDLTELPDHLLVLGGGPIGIEMAQAFRRLGSRVSVLEASQAMGAADREMAELALASLRADGVDIFEGAAVSSVSGAGGNITVTIGEGEDARRITGSHLLVATGRKLNTDTLALDAANIAHDKKGIEIDSGLRSTTNKRVYAVGDVSGGPAFTHTAGYQAGLVMRPLLFRIPAKMDASIQPAVTYCDPPLAQIGLTEKQAREKHGKIDIRRFALAENDRARAERKTEGHVKMVIAGGKIVGVHIFGDAADEMIGLWCLAVQKGMKPSDVTGYVPPYPTRGEIGKRAATDYYSAMARRPAVRRIIAFLRRFG
ncbi:dihydrolipoyl dehydrogenase family protein [Notoacmeibacter ruber]|uniref:Dihydrolipoamide dehydrogenase n=1 Tax=Notoacmeibacter ruber TaxID=2670375 RepID=A0A3L7J8X6_9HYPH|nr:FAD-dependent oxidoreductase [Notoacmeibacter ruber]RLQ87076.1 dihydrolipoamide dehydrogenase [Notoacmeibacter ruber]